MIPEGRIWRTSLKAISACKVPVGRTRQFHKREFKISVPIDRYHTPQNHKGVSEMRRLQFCLAVFAILALTMSAFAQVQNGQITGTVTDPSGAAIPNAKVTVTNAATGLNVSATSNASGNYTVKELPIGTYKLVAEGAGFKTVSNTDVVVNAGTISHVDFKMT